MKTQYYPLSEEERLARLDVLADWMDSRWRFPGTDFRIGIESILGLLPGIGDSIAALVSAWIIKEAHHLGAPFHIKFRMGWNIFLDWILGLIPFFGDIFDIGWKANRKNVALLRKYMEHYRNMMQ